jgi:polyphosphate kinase 2 (PPK2 family)
MADKRAAELGKLIEPLRVAPGKRVVLSRDYDPGMTAGWLNKEEGEEQLRAGVQLLAEYQARLAAQGTWAVLVVLQALDAAGKDGTIRHVMSGVNPQGVPVHSFKAPPARGGTRSPRAC